jgi:hypothetical protein
MTRGKHGKKMNRLLEDRFFWRFTHGFSAAL